MPTFAPPRPLADVADLVSYLNPVARGVDETDLYERVLDAASRRVEERTGRQFTPTPTSDAASDVYVVVQTVPGDRLVRVPDVREASEVTVDGVALDAADYTLRPRAGRPDEPAVWVELPYPAAGDVAITGRFGFEQVPADVREATVVMAARAVYERNARLADVTQDPEGGVASYFRSIPPTVAATLDAYRVARVG